MLFVIHLLASAGLAWSLGAGHLGGGLLAFALLYLIARLLGLAVQRLGRYARSLEHGVSFCLWFIAQVFLATYHVAAHADVRGIEAEWLDEEDHLSSPMGSRGIGEIGIVGTAAAVANATYHATGIRVRELPLTPDRFLG